jgi:hypothetical protein
MVRVVGWMATLLGHSVRLALKLFPVVVSLVAMTSIVYGVWLLDGRIAYIVGGLFLLVLLQPPARRKS